MTQVDLWNDRVGVDKYVNLSDPLIDQGRLVVHQRHLTLAKRLIKAGYFIGLASSADGGMYWCVISASPQSNLLVTVDLDLLLLTDEPDRVIETEALAHEEGLRQRIETGWKPEV